MLQLRLTLKLWASLPLLLKCWNVQHAPTCLDRKLVLFIYCWCSFIFLENYFFFSFICREFSDNLLCYQTTSHPKRILLVWMRLIMAELKEVSFYSVHRPLKAFCLMGPSLVISSVCHISDCKKWFKFFSINCSFSVIFVKFISTCHFVTVSFLPL